MLKLLEWATKSDEESVGMNEKTAYTPELVDELKLIAASFILKICCVALILYQWMGVVCIVETFSQRIIRERDAEISSLTSRLSALTKSLTTASCSSSSTSSSLTSSSHPTIPDIHDLSDINLSSESDDKQHPSSSTTTTTSSSSTCICTCSPSHHQQQSVILDLEHQLTAKQVEIDSIQSAMQNRLIKITQMFDAKDKQIQQLTEKLKTYEH